MKKFTLLTTLLTASILTTSATAELIELTANKSDINKTQETDKVHKLANSNAGWMTQPRIRVSHRDNPCYCTPLGELSSACYAKGWSVTSKLLIDKEGNVKSIKVVKSDANNRTERSITRSLRRAKFMPFKENGQAISGYVTLPINIVNSEYNPKLQCPVVDSGEMESK